jgi:hypothetical protein
MRVKPVAAIAALVLSAAAGAQDRPSEEDLFGGPPAPAQPAPPANGEGEKKTPPAPTDGGAAGPRGEIEGELFGSQSSPQATPPPQGALIPRDREDWLDIGGLLQLRAVTSALEDTAPRDWPFASPNLLDVYLDTRPNDRVRGFVLARMNSDPTLPEGGAAGQGSPSFVGLPTSSADNPGVALDQLWVKFDLYRHAFVTAGRQHVKWGVGRFWNPTDYLHPVKRDPLATFDVRTGTTLVRLHVPWEKRGWNFSGVAILEDLAGDTTQPTNRLGRLGVGGRAELVLGAAELGLDAVAQDGHHPRYGIDLSTGLGDFDLYGEAALRSGGDRPRWIHGGGAPAPFPELADWQREDPDRLTPQLVVGGTWALKYSDEDALTIGAEYFYNDLGYDDSAVYPFLLFGAPAFDLASVPPTATPQDPSAYQPFYLGKHYAGVNLTLPQPGRWNDTTLIFSVLGNLSDRSYVARFDASVRVLTYMTVETFVAGHFGSAGGEFRLVLPPDIAAAAGAASGGSFAAGAPVVDVGVGLRLSL